MLEKVEEGVTGALKKVATFDEIGAAFRFDAVLLAVSGAIELAAAVVPPVPKDRVLAGFASVFVLSDLAAATVEVLEPKLNVGNAGDDDDEMGGLLLDTAKVVMVVDAAELTAGLSVGVTFDNFGDDEGEKPLLRLGEVDAAEAKWRGAVHVDAPDGNTLSDDLWTSSALSLSSPLSKLVLSNVVGLVALET